MADRKITDLTALTAPATGDLLPIVDVSESAASSKNKKITFQDLQRYYDSDASHYVAFAAPGTVSTNLTWTLPATDGTTGQVLSTDGSGVLSWSAGGGGGVSDGDKGDITVSGSGATWTIDNDAVTYAKIQNVTATDKLLGRSTAGAGDVEEITCTAAGRALLDDADAAAQRSTLAAAGTGVSNTFSAAQTFGADVTLNAQSDLRFADSDSSNWVAFQAPATVAANVTWTLPAADGTTGQVLSTDGSGTLSWETCGGGGGTPGGSDTQIQYNDGGSFGGDADLTWDDTGKVLGVGGDVELDDGGTYTTTVQVVTPTADRTISFPNATGTVALVGGSNQQVMFNNAGALSGGNLTYSTTTGVFGYGTGRGTVTQATNKSTGVTLNAPCGAITLNNATLNADTTVSFTLTNSSIAATDLLILNHVSGGTAGSYLLNAQAAAGSASINVRNITAGNLGEAIVIGFAVIKS
jgi:hypothetical protein